MNHAKRHILATVLAIVAVIICGHSVEAQEHPPLFQFIPASSSGIRFANYVTETEEFNMGTFVYAYNGAGVAVGDIDGDGLPDIFFGSTQVSSRLYRNLGTMRFEDITEQAGVADSVGVTFGVSMVDIDGDGDLDIYLCKEFVANILYINNGDGTFTNRAHEFGLDFDGRSMQAAFFDYDRDGDLDVYIAVNGEGGAIQAADQQVSSSYTNVGQPDHLFRNNGNGTFTDVSKEAGIFDYGFAQSVGIGDLNDDGWPDIYVANDFEIRDILYINNHDGTFRDASRSALMHTSAASMGNDIADFNNDGYPDIMTLDMLPEDHKRKMSHIGVGSVYTPTFDSTQLNRNVLQLNRGNGTFADIGQLSGVAETDWSWSALFEDLDNDGYKDLFITNGYKRDVSNQDVVYNISRSNMDKLTLFKNIPTTRLQNYVFHNNGDLTFSKYNDPWGITEVVNSNGAVFADLDLDGDLDLVINNMDSISFVYRGGAADNKTGNYIRIRCKGLSPNTEGIGSKIEIRSQGKLQMRELYKNRGYLSSMEAIAHFGLGKATSVDEITVHWPDGSSQTLHDVPANQVLVIDQKNAVKTQPTPPESRKTIFQAASADSILPYSHKENVLFDDFLRERLLPQRYSRNGPGIAVGDVDGNGLEDVFIGGAKFSSGAVYLQQKDGRFMRKRQAALDADSTYEDMGALLFDADGDGDLDLYVVSGGNELVPNALELQDRLYLNDGKGTFTRSKDALPEMLTSGSCVVAADFDGDGDLDLFVGGRVVPGRYPEIPRSYLLMNNKGRFTDVTEKVAPGLAHIGMITSAIWTDFDNDNDPDLMLVGEWISPTFFRNDRGKLTNILPVTGLDSNSGWWNSITSGDFDNDGDIDYVVGNLGLNTDTRHKASTRYPLQLYAGDFDDNGSMDIVLSYFYKGVEYPIRDRMTMATQMPALIRRKFPTYASYASSDLAEVLPKEKIPSAIHMEAQNFATSYIENLGNGKFRIRSLPPLAQVSPTFGMIVEDFNADGNLDLLLVGNFNNADQEVVRYDAGDGLFLTGDGHGNFAPVPVTESGFTAPLETRGVTSLQRASSNCLYTLVVNNDGPVQVFERTFANSEGKLMNFENETAYSHLIMTFQDGRKRRYECSMGSGYLSQCSGTLLVTPEARSVTLYRGSKEIKEIRLPQPQ